MVTEPGAQVSGTSFHDPVIVALPSLPAVTVPLAMAATLSFDEL